ncbi:MAG: hypothetical protein LBS55_11725 [Prevotellaceae bacterium]|jgi:hypothetical protein|nr:hypothetical protein [Prevotellaceae bacterium]
MKTINSIAFLCGYFSIREKSRTIESISSQWEKIRNTEKEKSELEKYYYPEFVNFCYQSEKSKSTKSMERYRLPINREIAISLPAGKIHSLFVKSIQLFVFPYNLLIYAIEIEQNGADLNDITASLSILRNIPNYQETTPKNGYGASSSIVSNQINKEDLLKTDYKEILQPIIEIYRSVATTPQIPSDNESFPYSLLMENSNKLKIFHIVEIEPSEFDEKKQNNLLFELGTLAPTGSYNSNNFSSPSQEYFDKIMSKNKISIFNNWKGLALLDTFTILCSQTQPYLLDNWKNYYFGMIYIHSLFLKFYLFRINILFRKKNANVARLEKGFISFECDCCFHKISYNFLPLEIYQSLDTGMEINDERKQLYSLIEREKNVQEKQSDRKMNSLLFILTCLTIFSTVWDFTCMFNALYPYEIYLGSAILGYRLLTSVLLLVIFAIFLGLRFVGKNKQK